METALLSFSVPAIKNIATLVLMKKCTFLDINNNYKFPDHEKQFLDGLNYTDDH